MNKQLSLFTNKYINNNADKTLVLLHGTGGNEEDFLFLNDQLSETHNLLGIRGNIDEQGMNRFFKRKSVGVFDQESIKKESGKFTTFIQAWLIKNNMNIDQLAFLGYSNGANMLIATMFYFPKIIKNAVLLHPMLPFTPKQPIKLSENTMFVSYSTNDEMVLEKSSIELITLLQTLKAQVTFKTYSTGHQISSHEMRDAITFLS